MIRKRSATTLCQALPTYFDTGLFSDVRLQFYDNSACWGICSSSDNKTKKKFVGELRLHKFVLYSGSVPALTQLIDRRYDDLDESDTVHMELDFSAHTWDVVCFFFSLIYHNKLAHSITESETMAAKLDENVLQLHQLASFYGFTELIDICHERAARLFSSNNVADFSAYCLHPLSQQAGHFYVPSEKHLLYTKLLHWYQLCIDDVPSDALFGAGAGKPLSGHRIKRALPHDHNSYGNKTVVIGQKKKWVENFQSYELPVASSVSGDTTSTQRRHTLHHYKRLCPSCIEMPNFVVKGNNVINMGVLDEQWSFSITYPMVTTTRPEKREVMLFLKKLGNSMVEDSPHTSSEEHMSVESGSQEQTKIKSKIHLFSRSMRDDIENTRYEELETLSDMSDLTRIGSISLHDPTDCYESICDRCQRQDDVYIFCVSVTITCQSQCK